MSRKVAKILVIAFAGLVLMAGLAYLFRDPLATRGAAFILDRNGETECTHPDIHITKTMKTITLSPFECEIYKPGPLKFFKADTDVVLTLDGLKLTHIFVAHATMEQRERKVPDVESNTLGDVSNIVGVRDQLLKGMLDASEQFSPGGPVLEADTLVAKRDGKVESMMKGFRRTFEDGMERQHAARMEGGAPGIVAMRDFDMRVNKSRGKLSLAVHFGKPERGDKPDLKLKMEARGLDQKSPYVSMSL